LVSRRLVASAIADDRVGEDAAVTCGCLDLDEVGDQVGDAVDRPLGHAANSGSLRTDAPNSSRNAARLSATKRK
jgi:hypothetical protein